MEGGLYLYQAIAAHVDANGPVGCRRTQRHGHLRMDGARSTLRCHRTDAKLDGRGVPIPVLTPS